MELIPWLSLEQKSTEEDKSMAMSPLPPITASSTDLESPWHTDGLSEDRVGGASKEHVNSARTERIRVFSKGARGTVRGIRGAIDQRTARNRGTTQPHRVR